MDFMFADVSRSFLNMVQQDIPKVVMSDGDSAGPSKQAFAEKLSKTLEKIESHENRTSIKMNSIQVTDDFDKLMESLSEKLSREKGFGFVSAMKNIFLMLSKGDLKNVSIDADGLDALKKMLLKAGFTEKDINDLIAELSEELENKDLTLDDLFDKLFELPFEANSEIESDQENFLETSAIPFLESILNSLGIPKENIQEIFIASDKGEKGISLDVVIEKLQALQKSSFYNQSQYKTQEGDNNFRLLFKQLNLDQGESKTSQLTLDELVSSLESLRKKILHPQVATEDQTPKDRNFQPLQTANSQFRVTTEVPTQNVQKPIANEKSFDFFNALFKGLEFKEKAAEHRTFEFSYEQIKNQFKNPLLVPDEENATKSVKHATDITLKEGLKEIESFLNGKKEGFAGVKDHATENKGFIKQMKSGNAKLSDQTQISSSDLKTNETHSGLNMLKAKPALKNLPNYVTQQVSKSLVRAINQGENIIKIQLKPPELGRLVMTIDNTGNSTKVSIMTDNIAAKEILTSNVNELRSVLSTSGVNLERFDVDMNSNFRQSMAEARNQTGNSGKRHPNREKIDSINGEGMNDPAGLLEALNQGGSLHFVA